MPLLPKQFQAINELASLLYPFLPNKPHPYADQSISFAGVASDLGLAQFYSGGSKLPTVTTLLARTLEYQSRSFCSLILQIINRALVYRNNKDDPLHREDIEAVNQAVAKVGFKIPELWDISFLESLPRRKPPSSLSPAVTKQTLDNLKNQLLAVGKLHDHERGPAFERFLQALFRELKLDPKGSIRLTGEQIDGSFDLDGQTYLLEAKFHAHPVGPGALREFRDKVEGKATWSRGLFVSWSGFSPDASEALSRGKSTSIIGMTGQDLFFVLEGRVTLQNAIRMKTRRAAETGEALVSLQQLLLEAKR
jgi:hypothetical protein